MSLPSLYKMKFGQNEYDSLMPVCKTDYDFDQSICGNKISTIWKTLRIKQMHPDAGLALPDAPFFYLFPVFNKKTLDCLYPLIADDVEILSLEYNNDTSLYYGINVVGLLDAVDYENSRFIRFRNSNKILTFQKYAFKPEIVKHKNIFKIVDEPRSSIFVSEQLRNLVLQNDLSGFLFEQVW